MLRYGGIYLSNPMTNTGNNNQFFSNLDKVELAAGSPKLGGLLPPPTMQLWLDRLTERQLRMLNRWSRSENPNEWGVLDFAAQLFCSLETDETLDAESYKERLVATISSKLRAI
jgi:hypothetical protein